jgi:hypothetical protein
MEAEEEVTQIITPLLPAEEQPNSLLDQLAAKRRDVSENREVLIPVPGYEAPPLLLIKYRLLEGTDIDRIGRNMRQDRSGRWDKQLNAMFGLMTMAVLGVFVDVDGGGTTQPLTINGVPVTQFSTELAQGLGYATELPESPTSANVIFGLFGNNELAIAEHCARLNRWMSNTSADVNETLLGGNL